MSSVVVRTPGGLGLFKFKIAEGMNFLEARDGVRVEAIERVGKLKLEMCSI